MKTYEFILKLAGSAIIDEDLTNRLYDAGCDDCFCGGRCGEDWIHVSREAENLQTAIRTVVKQVESVDPRLKVKFVEFELDEILENIL